MIQEERDLLFIELSARLHYRVKVQTPLFENPTSIKGIAEDECWIYSDEDNYEWIDIEEVKPYLRPMLSMTEEERKEFSVFIGKTETYAQQICLDADSMANPIIGGFKCVYWSLFDKCADWLNKHYFDYRGLIPKDLAIEAPKDMYKTE